MQKVVSKLVSRLIKLEIVEKEDEAIYQYQAEILLIKIVSILLISLIGVLEEKYIETIVFYTTFSILRRYTNGYHAKNFMICLLESAISYIIICKFLSIIIINNLYISYILTLFSMVIIFILSPVNSDSIMLNKKEIRKHKEITGYILIIYFLIILACINFKIKHVIVSFFQLAILFDMVLVVIGKIVYKDWRWIMKKFEKGTLKVLKSVLDKGIDNQKQASSHCLSLLYQPKRIVNDKQDCDYK